MISSLSFPSDFSGAGLIREIGSEIKKISNNTQILRDWLKKTINNYDTGLEESISNIDSVEVIDIKSLRGN